MTTLEQLSQAVAAGKSKDAKALTQRALDEGTKPGDIVDEALVPAMASVGEKFKNNEIFVPEMLIAARAMKEAMGVLEPSLLAAGITPEIHRGDRHGAGRPARHRQEPGGRHVEGGQLPRHRPGNQRGRRPSSWPQSRSIGPRWSAFPPC